MKSNLELMQNVVKPYIDAKNQALTNEVYRNWATGKNVWNFAVMGQLNQGGIYFTPEDNVLKLTGASLSGAVWPTTVDNAMMSYTLKPNTAYKISFGVQYSSAFKLSIYLKETSASSWNNVLTVDSGTEATYTTPATWAQLWIRVEIASGYTLPVALYPMIREASITDPTYQPYAKTNVELTQDVAVSNNNTNNQIASAKYGHVNVVTMSGASLSDGDSIAAYVTSLPISNNVPWAVMFDGTSHTNVTVYLQIDGVVRLIDSTGHAPASAMSLYGQLTYIN